jgi:hypothetical protein
MTGRGHNQLSFKVQEAIVLAHLRDIGPLTPWEALHRYGVFRLAARIWVLRQAGHKIITHMVKNDFGNHYAEYVLVQQAKPEKEEAA